MADVKSAEQPYEPPRAEDLEVAAGTTEAGTGVVNPMSS